MPPPSTNGGLTTNYQLVRVAISDLVNIDDDFNYNWDTLDGILTALQSDISGISSGGDYNTAFGL